MKLEKTIKKKLIETKEQKKNLLIERNIIESRLMMVIGDKEISRFKKLTEEEQGKIAILYLMEISSLNEEGLINENFVDILKNIFGAGFWALPEAFVEKAINSFLGAIGIPDSNVRKFLVSFFATNPTELLKAFRDCKTLVTHIARAIMETMVMNLSQTKGVGGVGWDTLRNALQNHLQKAEFVKSIEDSFSAKVCELFGKYSGNAKDIMTKLKPALAQPTN